MGHGGADPFNVFAHLAGCISPDHHSSDGGLPERELQRGHGQGDAVLGADRVDALRSLQDVGGHLAVLITGAG